jgi:hypothetical protein
MQLSIKKSSGFVGLIIYDPHFNRRSAIGAAFW